MTTLYRHFDVYGTLLYVGITSNLKRRTAEHKARADWFKNVAITKTEELSTREHAAALEQVAIRFEKPLHNKAAGPKAKVITNERPQFQGPPTELEAALGDAGRDIQKAALLMAQFLHVTRDVNSGDLFEQIGPQRFHEVANMNSRRYA